MQQLLALTAKDLRLLVRDKVGLFFALVFPIVYSTLFGSIMGGMGGGSKGMAVAVVDEDKKDGSEKFVVQLEDLKELRITRTNREEAQDFVRRGKRTAFVILPEGFGEARRQMFGNPPRLQIGVDPSRAAESGMLQGILMAQLYKGIQEMFTDPAVMNERLDETIADIRSAEDMDPLTRATLSTFLPALKVFTQNMSADDMQGGGFPQPKIEKLDVTRRKSGPQNAYGISFPQGCIWGIMGCAAAFGITLVVERTSGTLVRLRMAPIGRWQILAGKGLACLLTTLAVGILLFALAAIVFDVRPNSYVSLAVALVCIAICFVGIMMLLSVLGKTEQSAGGIGWSILVLMAMIGGGMIPLAFMPEWMQQVSIVSPVKWSILAMEGAVWRDFSVAEMLTPCAVLIGIGIGSFGVGVSAFKWSE